MDCGKSSHLSVLLRLRILCSLRRVWVLFLSVNTNFCHVGKGYGGIKTLLGNRILCVW